MDSAHAIELLEQQRNAIEDLRHLSDSSREFKRWRYLTEAVIREIFGKDSHHLNKFLNIFHHIVVGVLGGGDDRYESNRKQKTYLEDLGNAEELLSAMIDEIHILGLNSDIDAHVTALDKLERMCSRFHIVARRLCKRHDDRDTLTITDEYDVQDLLHALLLLDFDDVRPEEWTPSCAGGSARTYFLLKKEKIFIEVNKTHKKLSDKVLGEQLLVDIDRYQRHPDCGRLVCFIYDPEEIINKPVQLVSDLENNSHNMPVRVIICPKRA